MLEPIALDDVPAIDDDDAPNVPADDDSPDELGTPDAVIACDVEGAGADEDGCATEDDDGTIAELDENGSPADEDDESGSAVELATSSALVEPAPPPLDDTPTDSLLEEVDAAVDVAPLALVDVAPMVEEDGRAPPSRFDPPSAPPSRAVAMVTEVPSGHVMVAVPSPLSTTVHDGL